MLRRTSSYTLTEVRARKAMHQLSSVGCTLTLRPFVVPPFSATQSRCSLWMRHSSSSSTAPPAKSADCTAASAALIVPRTWANSAPSTARSFFARSRRKTSRARARRNPLTSRRNLSISSRAFVGLKTMCRTLVPLCDMAGGCGACTFLAYRFALLLDARQLSHRVERLSGSVHPLHPAHRKVKPSSGRAARCRTRPYCGNSICRDVPSTEDANDRSPPSRSAAKRSSVWPVPIMARAAKERAAPAAPE